MRQILVLLFLSALLSAAEAPNPKKFCFVYTVNNAGFIDVCGCKNKKVKQGSIARRATLIKHLRALGKPLVLVDGGSTFFFIENRSPKETEKKQLIAKAFVIVESYNRMGYQAMAMGSSDLRLGLDNLKKLAKAAQFPVLSANFFGPDGKRVFPPWTIIESGNVRIGVIGLVIGTLNKHFLAKVAPGCRVTNCVDAAKQAAAELKDKVDLIVALSHAKKEENQQIAKEVPDIRILFDPNINYSSHSLFMSDPKDNVDRFGDTLILRADGEGMRVLRTDIEFEVPHGKIATSDELNRLDEGIQADPVPDDLSTVLGRGDFNRGIVSRISVEPQFLMAPGIKLLVDNWKKGTLVEDMKFPPPPKVTFAGKDACKECHEKQYNFWLKTPHATAMESLREMGDHRRYDCIGCHTVGFGIAFVNAKDAEKFAGVQCESCHGTNPAHIDDPDKFPTWSKIKEKVCIECHNERQLRVPFNYRVKRKLVACPKMD